MVPSKRVLLASRGAAATAIGPVRPRNEDCFIIDDALGLYAVADGVGGAPDGDWASRTACEVLRAHVARHLEPVDQDHELMSDDLAGTLARVLNEGFQLASEKIFRISGRRNGERSGTTLSAVLLRQGRGVVAHCGDSRIYRLRNGAVEIWTNDHILQFEGATQAERESEHAHFALSRALGPHPSAEVDISAYAVHAGDALALCTDGCYETTRPSELPTICAGTPEAAAARWVDESLQRGCLDNSTAVIVLLEELLAAPNPNESEADAAVA